MGGFRRFLRRLSRVRVSVSVTWQKPPIFESKLLSISILYLLTTVSLCIYASFSRKACDLRLLLPFDVVKTAAGKKTTFDSLFQYPAGYGPHKHALPAASSSCDNPLFFTDYGSAYDEIHKCSLTNAPPPTNGSTPPSPSEDGVPITYMAPNDATTATFGGNFSSDVRKSYLDLEQCQRQQGDNPTTIPCGFLKEFPISDGDKAAMENCNGVVVLSALFGDHDKIRQPMGLGPNTLAAVCFFMFVDDATINSLRDQKVLPSHHHQQQPGFPPRPITLGVWRLVRLDGDMLPYTNPAMNGVIPKHLPHRLFPNARFSVWVDAKIQLTVDPLLLVQSLLLAGGDDVDMAISKHPFNVHTMEEAVATARWKKWGDLQGLRTQMETYCRNGLQPWSAEKLPYTSDVPDTALILRRHGPRTNHFSCLLFNELDAFNPRDQLAFAYVRDLMNPKINIHMFSVDAFEQVTVEYRHNLKPTSAAAAADGNNGKKMSGMRADRGGYSWDINNSSCRRYLSKMWGETLD